MRGQWQRCNGSTFMRYLLNFIHYPLSHVMWEGCSSYALPTHSICKDTVVILSTCSVCERYGSYPSPTCSICEDTLVVPCVCVCVLALNGLIANFN